MKKLLVVVDYQNDFVDGALGFPGAELLDSRIAGKIAKYRDGGYDVVYTFDTHYANYLETQEGVRLPVTHTVLGTEGWKLYGEVGRLESHDERRFLKSAFGSIELGEYLCNRDYDEIELCGLVSYMCVISNAVIAKAALPEARILVDASALAGPDPELNAKALDVMAAMQMDVINRDFETEAD